MMKKTGGKRLATMFADIVFLVSKGTIFIDTYNQVCNAKVVHCIKNRIDTNNMFFICYLDEEG